MPISFKGAYFPKEIILTCVRWYVAYPLSTRHLKEMMAERGGSVAHSTVNHWVIKADDGIPVVQRGAEHVGGY